MPTTAGEIAAALGAARREGAGWRCRCPAHDDHEPSLSVTERDGKTLLVCRAGCDQTAVIGALQSRGLWRDPVERPAENRSRIVATYNYRDAAGALKYQVVRLAPKDFRQRRPNGSPDTWQWDMHGVKPLPYRLPEFLSDPDVTIWIPEGEKDCDALGELGLVATCNHGGAKKWRPEISHYLAGRNVVVLPDDDEPGRAHACDVAGKLAGIAASIRILELPGLPPKGDVSDWLATGGTVDELERLAAATPPFLAEPPEPSAAEPIDRAPGPNDAEIARLATLSLLAYERERTAAAKKLGCRASVLDRVVTEARGAKETTGQGRALNLPEPERWPDPVDGAALLDEIAATVRGYVVLGENEAVSLALWSVATHAFDAFRVFPRLFATSPEKGCGKSTLLDVIARLVPRPLSAANITAAAVFRVIESARPTLLLDEADSFARDNEDLRGVLDAGHRRDGAVIRTVGDDHQPRQFSCWAPVALAAIGRLPGTIEDRSIIVRLRRRRPEEMIESLRLDRAGVLDELARKAARWAADHSAPLATTDPKMPSSIYNRAADNWRPLLAVAECAGGGWPNRARSAAIELTSDSEDEGSVRVQLLGDIRQSFEGEPSGVIFTGELLAGLAQREDRPWPEWKAGKPITARQLAAQLKPFGITTNQTVRRGSENGKGYRREWFDDAFARYLPSPSVTQSQVADCEALSDFQSVTPVPNVTDAFCKNPSDSTSCDCVTDRKSRNKGDNALTLPEDREGNTREEGSALDFHARYERRMP